MSEIVVRARAKLNLRLAVLAREDTGFHQIETLFALVDLADEIRIVPGGAGVRLAVEGAEVGPAADNLVTRAAQAWCAAANVEPDFGITLVKHIPAGAGLGGGSSDAAATLAALDALAPEPLGRTHLVRIAARLGSDVPFFLAGAPYALAWGRGDRCLRLAAPPDRPVLLGIADPPVSTARAYERIDAVPRPAGGALLEDAAALATWRGIARVAGNHFADVLLPAMPGARGLLEVFRSTGALVADMTGSGAAVFGVFEDEERRAAASAAAHRAVPDAWLTSTRTAFAS